MKPLFIFSVILAYAGFSGQPTLATSAPADLVQQVQAADLLADLITYTVDRSDARINDAQKFLQSIGKAQAYAAAPPNPSMPKPLNYMLLYRGSLSFIEGNGQKYADPAVNDEPQSRLYDDLTAAQYYNMHEFLHFNQQRQEFASIQAYLESIRQYDRYLDSIREIPSAAGSPTTQPKPATPEAVSQRMGDLISFIHETAWKQAQAKGISQAGFDEQWPEQVKRYRESVMTRMEESQPADGGFGVTEVAGTPPPPTSAPAESPQSANYTYINSQPDIGANRQLPPTVQSPYSNAAYRAKDLSLWNMWDYNPRY